MLQKFSQNKTNEEHTTMKPHKTFLAVCVSTLLIIMFSSITRVTALAQGTRAESSPLPPATIAGTQSLSITSSIVGQDFNLYVNLPRDYQDTTKSLPVIYLLDGQWDFPLLNAIFGEEYYDGFVPGVIVVGIAWGGKEPNYDFLRARDLSPTHIDQVPQSGGAPKFLDFLKKELIPFVDSKYRTNKNDRTLVGSSFGGLFTLYALFHETELFNRYILTSPAIGWDNQSIYSFEKEFAEKTSRPPVRVFMAVGGLEGDVDAFEKFVDHLKSKNYKGLEVSSRVLEGMGHSGGKAEGYTRGLQAVFAKPSVKLDRAILEQYVGTYQVGPDIKVKVQVENNSLIAFGPDNSKIAMVAASDKEFYVNGTYLLVHFKTNEKGKVTGFQLEQYSGQQFVEKID